MNWSVVKDGKTVAVKDPYWTGPNAAYDADPGFVDAEHLDFRLKPGSKLATDLPGFKAIPVEKIGLYLDEYRTKLPTADEIDRFNKRAGHDAGGSGIEDRN